jgi:outer membrane lipoprotein LolB
MLMSRDFLSAIRIGWLLLFSVLLASCAGLAPAPRTEVPGRDALDNFALEGRFSLRYEDKSYSGRLSWRHDSIRNELLLASPFGQGMAEISTDEGGARLTTSDGKLYSAPSVEELTSQVLGYPLPLAQLTDWIRGRATAGTRDTDGFGRLLRLRHEGWVVDFAYAADGPGEAPTRIIAERAGGFELRLRIDEWNSLLPEERKS